MGLMIDAFKLLSLKNVGKLYKGVIHSSRRKTRYVCQWYSAHQLSSGI